MNFRRIAWGVGLLGALALLGCGGGDDTPTPNGWEGDAAMGGAGGAANDSSVVVTDSATGQAGGSVSDAMVCTTPSMSVNGTNITACKTAFAEAGVDGGEDDAGAACIACLCNRDPLEAKSCAANMNCKILECWRAVCKCPTATPEAGSDAPASGEGGGNDAATSDSPAGDAAAE